ncbi:MAG: HIT family protein [Planctomycetes bacterium]|nr:HIT family protein [Planctomycetota bacterium]
MAKFGHPHSLVREYERWAVLVRPRQVTLGSLVLVCTEPARSFSGLSPQAFTELGRAVADIERVLSTEFNYEKINYLMLMMVDPDVHFHVIPRYSSSQRFDNKILTDSGWPGPPDLDGGIVLDDEGTEGLVSRLRGAWEIG